MTTDSKAEGATGGRWYKHQVSGGWTICRDDSSVAVAHAWQEPQAERLVDLLNRGERAPTEANLRALREAFDAWCPVPKGPAAWKLEEAMRAVLSSSAAEPPKPEPKWGVWCIDEACFYDPTPRDWDDAVTATAMNCNTNRTHRFEVRELPPLDAPEPGKAEAKAEACVQCGHAFSAHGIAGCGAETLAGECPCARQPPKRKPSPPEPQGAQGVVCGNHWHGLSGEPVDGSTVCPWCHVDELQGQVAALETKLAEAERHAASYKGELESASTRCRRQWEREQEANRARDELVIKLATMKASLDTACTAALSERERCDRAEKERDEARAKLAEAEHELGYVRRILGGEPADATHEVALRAVKSREVYRLERDEARAKLARYEAAMRAADRWLALFEQHGNQDRMTRARVALCDALGIFVEAAENIEPSNPPAAGEDEP